MVGVPASSEGARARLPGRNPPPWRFLGKGVFRPCPPAPLLVAGETLTFLNSIPTLLSVFDFRTGSAIRGEELLRQKKPQKPLLSWFCRLTPLCGGAHARNPIFSLQIGNLRVGVGFGKLSLLSVLSSRTEQKRPGFSPWRRKSNLLTQTNAHFRDTYLKPVYRCILSQVNCAAKWFCRLNLEYGHDVLLPLPGLQKGIPSCRRKTNDFSIALRPFNLLEAFPFLFSLRDILHQGGMLPPSFLKPTA